MSVMGFQKKAWVGGFLVSSIHVYLGFLEKKINFAKPLNDDVEWKRNVENINDKS